MEMIIGVIAVVFSNNMLMSLIKALAAGSLSKTWLRTFLAALSVVGMIAYSSVTGDPVDFDSVRSLLTTVAGSAFIAVTSHFSYIAIKKA